MWILCGHRHVLLLFRTMWKLQAARPFKYFSASPKSKEMLLENHNSVIKIKKFITDASYYLTYRLYLNFTIVPPCLSLLPEGRSKLSPGLGEVMSIGCDFIPDRAGPGHQCSLNRLCFLSQDQAGHVPFILFCVCLVFFNLEQFTTFLCLSWHLTFVKNALRLFL